MFRKVFTKPQFGLSGYIKGWYHYICNPYRRWFQFYMHVCLDLTKTTVGVAMKSLNIFFFEINCQYLDSIVCLWVLYSSTLVRVYGWFRTGNKPTTEPMLIECNSNLLAAYEEYLSCCVSSTPAYDPIPVEASCVIYTAKSILTE